MLSKVDISLDSLSLIEISVPMADPFRSAIGRRTERRALLLRWTDLDGCWGIGECSCRPDPFFNAEFVDGAVALLRDHVFPLLPRRTDVRSLSAALERVRGWNFTIAALLDAVFDLLRRRGLADPLSTVNLPTASRVPVGISLGLFAAPDEAVRRVAAAAEAGYRRVKLKVAPAMDPVTLVAIRKEFPELTLAFDANGSCGVDDDAFLRRLAGLRPCFVEQPFPPRRLDLAAASRERLPGLAICLDESVEGLGDLIAAHHLGALDELNIKPGRVGGQFVVLELLEYCERHGIPAWVGGMFETGVGRHANLRLATRLPAATAHDLSPPVRYLEADVVRRPLAMSADGYLEADDSPVEVDEAELERLSVRRVDLVRDVA